MEGVGEVRSFYNEYDRNAAAWIRELIEASEITAGTVDERSICEIRPGDTFPRSHFFAGIGGWELALRLAGWPDGWPVWTGSCPCQPFSSAGKRKGVEDSRHLWPEFRRLIAECRPPVVFGEQVASADGRLWLTGVRSDLEALGYAVGAADLCSAGCGAPNIRQRLYWVACADRGECDGLPSGQGGEFDGPASRRLQGDGKSECGGPVGGMAEYDGLNGYGAGLGAGDVCRQLGATPGISRGAPGRLGSSDRERQQAGAAATECASRSMLGGASGLGYWDAFDILPCLDGKARRIEPGSFPLAHGVPGRVGLLRGYGNAINPWVAAEFIQAVMEAL